MIRVVIHSRNIVKYGIAIAVAMTRDAFISAIQANSFDVGGLLFDYKADNQRSDLVIATYLDNGSYRILGNGDMDRLLR